MKFYNIIAKVPTHHTTGDLRRAFNMVTKAHIDGSFTASQEFETEAEAKDYLTNRLNQWRDTTDMTEKEYQDQSENINTGYLRLAGITADIETSAI